MTENASNYSLLLVDDTPTNVLLLETILKKEGYKLFTAYSGESALEKTRTCNPDLILLDVMMPGMNGYEVLTHLKEDNTTSHIPVIMLTALTDYDFMEKATKLGAVDFVTKPFKRTELSEKIIKQLECIVKD